MPVHAATRNVLPSGRVQFGRVNPVVRCDTINHMTPNEPTPAKPIEFTSGDVVRTVVRTPGTGEIRVQGRGHGLREKGPDLERVLDVGDDGWTAKTEIVQGAITRATSEGAPSQGEADSRPCAGRFVGFRRSQGENWWVDPISVDVRDRPWVDCDARDRRDSRKLKRKPLQMQVKRAMVEGKRYAEWAGEGRFDLPSGMTLQQAAETLWVAIKRAQKKAASDVVLLLDADRLPWLALRDVVAEFRRLYGESATTVGFSEVYVVPWSVSDVAQLDTPEQA
jgi:hypothetical protein